MRVEREALANTIKDATLGLFKLFTIYLGDRLGFYCALDDGGPLTSPELAARTHTDERYAREWLEQQTVAGILRVEDETLGATARRYRIPPGHAEVLTRRDSLYYSAPVIREIVGVVSPLPAVLNAYRTGGGVPLGSYGDDMREGQADLQRVVFLKLLGKLWLPLIPDVSTRLKADPPARVADLGCGAGWASIAIARSYPKVHVRGFDLDAPSIELARVNAQQLGLADRVQFEVRDVADPSLPGEYELVIAVSCIHELADPVGGLRAMRRLAGERGVVLVVEAPVEETFKAGCHEAEQMMYGFSVLHCLPVEMSDQPTAATGTVIRPGTLRRYAVEAGFRDIEVLPITAAFWRFYRLA